VEVRPEWLERVREQYPLIFVTNQALCFDNRQLGVALASLAAMPRPGGVLI
jgi:hypothetical protein